MFREANWSWDFRESGHQSASGRRKNQVFNVFFFWRKEKTKTLLEECPNPISMIFWHAPVAMDGCPEERTPNVFALNLPLGIASSTFLFSIEVFYFCQRHREKKGILYKKLTFFYKGRKHVFWSPQVRVMALKEFFNDSASVIKQVNIDVNRIFLESKKKNCKQQETCFLTSYRAAQIYKNKQSPFNLIRISVLKEVQTFFFFFISPF